MLLVLVGVSSASAAVDSLRVMTYNIRLGGTEFGQPLSLTSSVIELAQADVIGLQEVGSSGPALAQLLGFHYHGFNSDVGILSRYPIAQTLNLGVRLELAPNQDAYVFNVHLNAFPYQPYTFRNNPNYTETQAIASARATRGNGFNNYMNATVAPLIPTGAPLFLLGDFNEPSHLDWTQEAADAGLNFGKKVDWPTSRAATDRGLVDAFREMRPDEVNDRAETWTPGNPPPTVPANEVHDRIDFVYYAGLGVTPIEALNIGYDAADGQTDLQFRPYPSDHRAVVVEFALAVPEPAVAALAGVVLVATAGRIRRSLTWNYAASA